MSRAAVYRMYDADENLGIAEMHGSYVITHKASGFVLGGLAFPSVAQARQAASALGGILARIRKARLLADVLARHGATADTAAALPPLGRAMVAELAGVTEPSEATWDRTVALLRVRVVV